MRNIIISPSLLSADFSNLESEVKKIRRLGAKWLHYDVMDGHFVNNITFGVPLVKSISKISNLFNDVHLMIENPKLFVVPFIDAGADLITFHYEACKDDSEVNEIIDLIHKNNCKAGLSIKPNTSYKSIIPFINKLQLILIMSVEPGFGGQDFMANSLDKISSLRSYIDKNKINCLIEVDGGINKETSVLVKNAGVDVIVSGSYLFGHNDIKKRFAGLIK